MFINSLPSDTDLHRLKDENNSSGNGEEEYWSLDELRKFPFVIHGSVDSIDRDVIYWIPIDSTLTNSKRTRLPSQKRCFQFCVENKQYENRNLIVVDTERGIVVDCFKGTCDAINNQIKLTYHLHKQEHECPVKDFVQRNIVLKMTRGMRQILSMVGRVCRIHKAKIRQQQVMKEFLGTENLDLVTDLLERMNVIHGYIEEDLTLMYHDNMKSNLKSLHFMKRVESVQAVVYSLICKQCILWEKEFRSKQLKTPLDKEGLRTWLNNHGFDDHNLFKNFRQLKKKQRTQDLPELIQQLFETKPTQTKSTELDAKTAGEEGDFLHIIKSITFQMVQTDAQLENIELYSKRMVVERDPRTRHLMYRDLDYMYENIATCFEILNEYRDSTTHKVQKNISVSIIDNSLNCFRVIDPSSNMNAFQQQCNGMLIDMKKERVICSPPLFLKTQLDNSLILQSQEHKFQAVEKLEFNSKDSLDLFFNYFDSKYPLYSIYRENNEIHILDASHGTKITDEHAEKLIVDLLETKLMQQQELRVKNMLSINEYTYTFRILPDVNQILLVGLCDLLTFRYLSPSQIQNFWKEKIGEQPSNLVLCMDVIDRVTDTTLMEELKHCTQPETSFVVYWINGQYFILNRQR
ncbi:hypothetical protein C9374_005388 [Naegleria lovaniensis]|uniref:Uncharacterized protein n=1 Tax=Naegleria lovaniensis TaxID=51637 RepID=A0AA88GJL3_NAELO|nr:uncharacterized protein C9374_005388 [Naegleria lovaniensis]KAG2382186.1 hypothetical protein C9374_005388 [Naegleria lovaniensis]